MSNSKSKCQWTSQADAFRAFATHTGKTQSSRHIKPLHWYIACRLVIEGGFDPEWITPRPPFKREVRDGRNFLSYAPKLATGNEQTILGGLKTKNVDVVVSAPSIGPVLAVSCKGVTKAFRNLTNRLEETIGECTNLHITYPALVLGYFAVIRANRDALDVETAPTLNAKDDLAAPAAGETGLGSLGKNDLAFKHGENVIDAIERFGNALSEMAGRHGIREEISRYEAMTLVMVEPRGEYAGSVFAGFPTPSSNLHLSTFFNTLYRRYHERFVLGAPLLSERTSRILWDPGSDAFADLEAKSVEGLGYTANLLDSN